MRILTFDFMQEAVRRLKSFGPVPPRVFDKWSDEKLADYEQAIRVFLASPPLPLAQDDAETLMELLQESVDDAHGGDFGWVLVHTIETAPVAVYEPLIRSDTEWGWLLARRLENWRALQRGDGATP